MSWWEDNPDMLVTPERLDALELRVHEHYRGEVYAPEMVQNLRHQYETEWREATYRWDSFVAWSMVELPFDTNVINRAPHYRKGNQYHQTHPGALENALEAGRLDRLFQHEESGPPIHYEFSLEEAEEWYKAPKVNDPVRSFTWLRWGFTPKEAIEYSECNIRAPHVAYMYKRKGVSPEMYRKWNKGVHGGMDAYHTPIAIAQWISEMGHEVSAEKAPAWALACWNSYGRPEKKWASYSFYRNYVSAFSNTSLEDEDVLRWAESWKAFAYTAIKYVDFFDDPEEASKWQLDSNNAATPAHAFAYSKMSGITPAEAKKWDILVGKPELLAKYLTSGVPFQWALEMEMEENNK